MAIDAFVVNNFAFISNIKVIDLDGDFNSIVACDSMQIHALFGGTTNVTCKNNDCLAMAIYCHIMLSYNVMIYLLLIY